MAKTVAAVIKLVDEFTNPSKKIVSQVKNVERRFDKFAGKVGKFGKTVEKYGQTMTAKFTAPLLAAGTAAVKFSSDSETATQNFLSATGIMGDAVEDGVTNAEKYRDMMEDIFKGNYYESIEDVADAMGKVKQNMDYLDDSALRRVTEYADVMADTFDVDVADSTRAADTLIKNFGVSAREAFNLMSQGAQKGLDFSGELYDNIDEYSVQFKKLGLGAEDMFNIFAAGAENGAFNLDKIGDAVKEFSIRAVDGSDTTRAGFEALGLDADTMAAKFAAGGDSARDAFQQVMAGLADMDDPLAQNAAGVNLFGTMWEDLGADVVTSLAQMEGPIDKTNESMEQLMATKSDNLKNKIAEFGRTLQVDVLAPIGDKLVPYVEMGIDKLKEFSKWWGNLSDDQQDMAIKIAAVVTAAGPFLTIGGKIIQTFTGPIKLMGQFAGGIKKFSLAAKEAGGVGKVLSSGFGKIGGVAKTIATGFLAIPGPVKIAIGVIAGIAAVAVLIYKNWDKIKDLFGKVAGKIGELKDAAVEKFAVFKDAAGEAFENAKNKVIGFRDAAAEKITDFGNKLLEIKDGAVQMFQTGVQTAFDKIESIFPGFSESIRGVTDGIKMTFSGIVDFVTGVFTGNWEKAWDGVVRAFGGIWDTLSSWVKAPLNAVIDLINKAIGAMNKFSVTIPGTDTKIGFNIPKIPNLYTGTNNWPGGVAAINEPKYGGEIVDLPQGSRVYPHDQSVEMARAEGSRTVTITIPKLADQIIVRSEADIDKIADALARRLERTAYNMA